MYRSMCSIKYAHLLFVALFISAFGYGCLCLPEPRAVKQPEMGGINPKSMLEMERAVRHPGPPPFSERLEPVTKSSSEGTRLYSLVFDNVPFREVFVAITKDTDLNIVFESGIDLSRLVTVHLKNVTFKEALDMIVKRGAGYAWKIEDGCLYIKGLEERVYHFDFLDLTGQAEIQVGGDMLASSVEDAGVSGKFELKAERKEEHGDIWTDIKRVLEGLKSSDGVLRISRTGGIIYMADTSKRIESMVAFLDSLSEVMHRQVYLDANIYEVRLSDENKYGIDWSSLETAFTSSSGFWPDSLNINFNSGSIVLSGQSSVSAALDFLKTQGDVSVLSNPHLSVTNRQSAVLTVGYQFPYGDISGVDRDTETGLITYGTSIKRAILGIQLGITPQISGDGTITLHIVPTITRIQREEAVSVPVAAHEVQTISNPVIDLQELLTTVRVKEGQTVVLAGLISQVNDLEHEGLPVLGSIPFIGRLFKQVKEIKENKELVIFITPYIRKMT